MSSYPFSPEDRKMLFLPCCSAVDFDGVRPAQLPAWLFTASTGQAIWSADKMSAQTSAEECAYAYEGVE